MSTEKRKLYRAARSVLLDLPGVGLFHLPWGPLFTKNSEEDPAPRGVALIFTVPAFNWHGRARMAPVPARVRLVDRDYRERRATCCGVYKARVDGKDRASQRGGRPAITHRGDALEGAVFPETELAGIEPGSQDELAAILYTTLQPARGNRLAELNPTYCESDAALFQLRARASPVAGQLVSEVVVLRFRSRLLRWRACCLGLVGFIRARSATPVSIVTGTDVLGLGVTTVARPNVASGVPLYLDDPNVAGGKRINRAAFSLPAAGTQGNLGRNVLRGFGMAQFDLSVRRQFRLAERVSLQFRADAFNILNHPNFSNPSGDLTNSNFGVSTQMLGKGLGSAGISGGFSPISAKITIKPYSAYPSVCGAVRSVRRRFDSSSQGFGAGAALVRLLAGWRAAEN